MVGDHRSDNAVEWAALTSIVGKIGSTTETLRRRCREETSRRSAPAPLDRVDWTQLKLLEREIKQLRRADEILREASGPALRTG
jgi:hypothetical protein